jgi:NDP-sugar pyrophosphorylase family protein
MRGMILAGGLSTRLYPLTLAVPKPLVPVMGRPVVAHVIEYLRGYGVDEIAINLHYFADDVERFIGDGSRWNVSIEYLREPELMGSAGAVRQMEAMFDRTFVVIGCDDVTNVDLEAALRFHRSRDAEATIVLVEADDVEHYGVVVTDDDGRIREFQEKPKRGTERSKLANTGIYIFEPTVLDRIPVGAFYDFGTQVFPEMLDAGAEFFGMRQRAYWCDIGTPREYRRAHFDALAGRVRLSLEDGARVEGGILCGAGARIAPTARLIAPVCVGGSCVIEPGARIASSILWDGVTVGEDATVEDAILGRGFTLAAGATVRGGEHAPEQKQTTR